MWVRFADVARVTATSEGRSVLWTRIAHRRIVHQTTPHTREERYPRLFDLAASLARDSTRILSFGCSTGEELIALRRRFPAADIIGSEINPRSRRIAARRAAADARITVGDASAVEGMFDLIFALAVFQREPRRVKHSGIEDLSSFYPHERFDDGVRGLAGALRPGGFLCIANAQYRLEDSSVAGHFEPVPDSPPMWGLLFRPDGKRLEQAIAHTIFRKRPEREAQNRIFDTLGPVDHLRLDG